MMGTGADKKDFYDVSIVDGYNLPLIAAPQWVFGVCNATGCVSDLNTGQNLTWQECRTKRSNGAILIPAPPMVQSQHTTNREISNMVSSSNILWPIPLMSIIIIILLFLNLFFQK